ncbi:MAG TPA: rRNA maturation RNase YbeY [Anaerolineae bacterium]|nr:rRNA maturation RNase YbeY [Anaerolineae bacterium]
MKARPEPEKSLHTVDVQIDEQFQVRIQPELLHRAASATLIHQRVDGPSELAVVVTGDDALHELNRRHRNVDAPTDVLAFPDETCGPFVAAPGLPRYLGDVIISFHRADAQAAEAGHDVQGELQLLVVHGVLHLLGYDDATDEQRAQMWTVQAQILEDLEVQVHLPT